MANIKSLVNRKNWNKVKRLIRQGQFKTAFQGTMRKLRAPSETVQRSSRYADMLKAGTRREGEVFSQVPSITVDIVIPVYNGVRYLKNLFDGIEKTQVSHNLIIVDDHSPDPAVEDFLSAYQKQMGPVYSAKGCHIQIILNERNLGFVASVNRGLVMSRHDVVLLNTDVEVPEGWLERLIMPLVKDPTVASATPFTNSGVIASFPDFLKDNSLFNQLPVDRIDSFFKEVPCRYTSLPTGVGFCMAMSQAAIKKIGVFDQQSFGRGYGEENDWCQRAIEAGFRNVMVENLYVFHNHGGTFQPDEKQRLMRENTETLLKKHPRYAEDVAQFNAKDPLAPLRAYVFTRMADSLSHSCSLIFSNTLGGGAETYLKKLTGDCHEKGEATAVVRYARPLKCYQIEFTYLYHTERIEMETAEEIFSFAGRLGISKVMVNQLVTYPQPIHMIKTIRDFCDSAGTDLYVMVNDYYCICPTIYLLDTHHRYCQLPEIKTCEECLAHNAYRDSYDPKTMKEWRSAWRDLLNSAHEVRVFSRDSEKLMRRAFGDDINFHVMPVQHTSMIKAKRTVKTTDTVNIGLFGTLTELKGAPLIRAMVQLADQQKSNVRFILIGHAEDKINSRRFEETGAYLTGQLPGLVLEKDLDLVFISSICPETYSFTTQEAMELGLPVACLDLGAPRERIAEYPDGLVLDSEDPQEILKELTDFATSRMPRRSPVRDQALFVYDEDSYAVRYRCRHLQEQLLLKGMRSDVVCVDQLKISQVGQYRYVILYRLEYNRKVNKIIDEANRSGSSIWFSIDDFVFDFQAIKDLAFLQQPEYATFPDRCAGIAKTMELCDGILVSTEALKKQVEKEFPGIIVRVQRNKASLEMQALARKALMRPKAEEATVTLGYFSGSPTHDADFAMIAPSLARILNRHPNVRLKLVGKVTVPDAVRGFENRIDLVSFRPWEELEEMYRDIDVNLMPVEDTVFHECKSENKWLEAALTATPTVASFNKELARVITSGTDGFLCRDSQEWMDTLEKLVTDQDLRGKVGEAAKEKVETAHTTFQLESGLLS